MFERFTAGARQVVVLAQAEARSLGHGYVGTEHVLLGLIREGDGVAARVLGSYGMTVAGVQSDVRRFLGEDSAGPADLVDEHDADALRAIGIDVDSVRRRIEESFGPGALEVASRSRSRRRGRRAQLRRPRRRGRGQPCPDDGRAGSIRPGGHIPFTPRSKKVLELSLREAIRLRHNYIGTEHVLLGLLREGEGLAAEVLVGRGVRLDELRQRVLVAIGKVA